MSLTPHPPPWSSEQREWLQALGYDVLVLAPAGGAGPVEPPEERAAAAKPGAAARVRPASSASPLLFALARAAGRNEQDSEFLAALPDLATLRGNPAARRALWPQLRGLRKRAPR